MDDARLDKPNMVDLKISLVLILLTGLLTVQELTELKPISRELAVRRTRQP